MIRSITQEHFFKFEIQPNMSEQEEKRQRNYDLLNAKTKPKFFFVNRIQSKAIFFLQKKRSLKEKEE